MIDLRYTEDEKLKENSTMMSKAPQYPYGMKIHFDSKTVKKLGLKGIPKVGDKVMVMAEAHVHDVSLDHETQDDSKGFQFGLQLETIQIKPREGEEKKEDEKEVKSAATTLYGDI